VTVAIAGSVAIVLGPLDGAVVAFLGAAVFASVGGSEAGELVALALWPAVVVAAGLFARRVERQRVALGTLVSAEEEQRKQTAHELNEEMAQALTGALLTLKQAERASAPDETGAATAATGPCSTSVTPAGGAASTGTTP
jgi:signal transduction histidine kinase